MLIKREFGYLLYLNILTSYIFSYLKQERKKAFGKSVGALTIFRISIVCILSDYLLC